MWVVAIRPIGQIKERMVNDMRIEEAIKFAGCAQTMTDIPGVKEFYAMAEKALRTQNQVKWISVKNDMPKEKESIFARFYGTDKWRSAMFRTASEDVLACVEYEDGSRLVKALHTMDGKWWLSGIPRGGIVTHWMPMPEPPERDDE